jgi:hypothetical protein
MSEFARCAFVMYCYGALSYTPTSAVGAWGGGVMMISAQLEEARSPWAAIRTFFDNGFTACVPWGTPFPYANPGPWSRP